ncbi:MAG: pyruvate kinase [Gammaproteobacteria bacterium]|nr:pyruvate kinase [Gammaproteobacteria bacterium]
MRRTKIVATLGPASDKPANLTAMIEAGVDVVRVNYSHDTQESHARRIATVRKIAKKLGREIAIMADLQGPKIRLEGFRHGPIELEEGDDFVIDATLAPDGGDERHVGVTYKDLPGDVKPGDTLLVDDGRIMLQVDRVRGPCIETVVMIGGELSNHKGINRQGGGLSAKALTRKDRADLRHALEQGVDYIAVSFPRSGEDIDTARKLIQKADSTAAIIAKIERAEAVENAEEIIRAADGVMIARGDLGVEIGEPALPPVQKRLIRLARSLHRTVITATQMMNSMIDNPMPFRAEVFDVANAVLDGTDAVMLSGETSVGKYPIEVVRAMARICVGSEEKWIGGSNRGVPDDHFDRVDQAIAMSTMYCANRVGATAIAALTETGSTSLWMSRMDSTIPIFALSPNTGTLRKVALYRGVHPVYFDSSKVPYTELTAMVLNELKARGAVKAGDKVIVTKGDLMGFSGGTNGMKIVVVDQFVEHVG